MPEIAPRVPDVCDDCQSPLVQRNDDQEGVVRKRFKIYRDETDPLVGYYQRQGKLMLVSALLTVAQRIALAAAALN